MTDTNVLTVLIVVFALVVVVIFASRGRPSVQDGALIYKYPSGLKYLFAFGFVSFVLAPFFITKTGFGFSIQNVKNLDAISLLTLAPLVGLQLLGIYYVNNYEIRIYDDRMAYGIAKKTIYFRDVLEVKHMVSGVGAVLIVLRNKKRISFTNSISGFYDLERTLKQKVAASRQ